MTSRFIIAALVLLSSGCQMFSYQEPAGDAIATVEFTSNETAAQPVICVLGKGFKATALSVTANTSDSQFVKDMNETMKKAAKVAVSVDASSGSVLVGFEMQHRQKYGARERCKVATRFGVIAGHTYTAHLIETDGHCGVEVSEAGVPLDDAFIAPWECQ